MTERGFDTGFWTDSFVQELPCYGKLLLSYLKTNEHCNPAGVYRITLATMSFETKIPKAELPSLLEELAPTVGWYQADNLVWVKDFIKEQTKSPKFLAAAAKALVNVANSGLIKQVISYNKEKYMISIPYQYYMDRVSILTRASVSSASAGAGADSERGGALFSGDLFSQTLQGLLSDVPLGIDKLSQHEAIKQKLADSGKESGYVSQSEYAVPGGRVDLCWLTQQGEVVAGFEIDYRTPRVNSLEKLRLLRCPHAYVLLRKGGLRFVPVEKIEEEPQSENATPASKSEDEESLSLADQEVISTWRSVKGFKMTPAAEAELVARLRTEFPELDLPAQSKAWAARKLSEPLKPTSRPSQQIWHWMEMERKFAKERSQREQGEGQRAKVHPREAYRRPW